MKKTLTAIMITFFFLTPALCLSGYRIHLKDGREFTTDRYWEAGDQIKFNRFGGEVGIPKNLVESIGIMEDLEDPPQPPTDDGYAPVQSDEKKDIRDESEAEKKKAGQDKIGKMNVYQQKKQKLMQEMQATISAFKEAKKNNNKVEKEKWWLERGNLRKKLVELEKAVRAANNGNLPGWWQNAR